MNEDTFNEKCDKVLFYLLKIYKSSNDVHYLTHITKLEADTGIRAGDEVIHFLEHEKKFLYIDRKDAYLQITSKGIAFISHSSFVKEQEKIDTETTLKWYEQENAKKIFEDYPNVDKRSKWAIWISVILLIVTIIRLLIGK